MRGRETLEFLGLWESLHNPDFKPVGFDGFRSEAGLRAFTMAPTNQIDAVVLHGLKGIQHIGSISVEADN